MQQILELNPENLKAQFETVLKPIRELTYLDAPSLNFDLAELEVPSSFSALQEAGSHLETMFRLMPTAPETFVNDILGEINKLGQGSAEIISLLGPFSNLTDNLTPLLEDLQDAPDFLLTELIPTLQGVDRQLTGLQSRIGQPENFDLMQLLQLNNLAATLPDRLSEIQQEPLSNLTEFDTINQVINNGTWHIAYNKMLQTVSHLDLSDPKAVKNVRVLLESGGLLRGQIVTGLDDLTLKAKQAIPALNRFEGSLVNFEQNATEALKSALQTLNPSVRGAIFSDELQNLVAVVERLELDNIKSNVKNVLQIIEKLIAQNLDNVTAALNIALSVIMKGVELAERAIIKASALLSNLVQQLADLIKSFNLQGIIQQVHQVEEDLMAKITEVLDNINSTVLKFYTFIKAKVIEPLRQINFKPIVKLIHDTLYKIAAILDHPQVQNAIEQAKRGVDLVVEKLDTVSLKPIFDEVMNQSEEVKTTLKSIDVSQLNPVLKKALSVVLGQVREAIDPPDEKVARPIFEEYQEEISPLVRQPLEFLIQQFAKIEEIIKQFEPGTLVANLLTPPFEFMLSKLGELLNPDKLVRAMRPVQDFYNHTLAKLDEYLNPQTLLTPVLELYNKLVEAAKAITPETVLSPVRKVIGLAANQLDKLGVENIVANVVDAVEQITDLAASFKLEDTAIWQEVDKVLALDFLDGLHTQFDSLTDRAGTYIEELDLVALQTALKPLISGATTIRETVLRPEIKTRLAEISEVTQYFAANITQLTKEWQAQVKRLSAFKSSVPNEDFTGLLRLLQGLNPISLMATQTQLIDELDKRVQTVATKLQPTWDNLTTVYESDGSYIILLLASSADSLKDYLKQTVEALVGEPIKIQLAALNRPLEQMRDSVNEIKTIVLTLLDYAPLLNSIPANLQAVSDKVAEIKDKVTGLDLSFLDESIQNVLNEVVAPLEALNPAKVVDDIEQLFLRVVDILKNFNPVAIVGSARDKIKIERGEQTGTIEIPFNTPLIATTPVGDIIYRTMERVALAEEQGAVEVLVQAAEPGRSSDLVSTEGVMWKIEGDEPLSLLVPTAPAPILSIATICREVILENLKLFHPAELFAGPLNDIYKKIIEKLESIGINRIFDKLLKKFEDLEQELKEGLNRTAAELKTVLAAVPL